MWQKKTKLIITGVLTIFIQKEEEFDFDVYLKREREREGKKWWLAKAGVHNV